MNEEQFDILDEGGYHTGITKARSEVHKLGLWHRAVHLWVITDDNEVLLQKRSSLKDSYPNCWDLSVGGHLEAGGHSKTTVIRESREEIGLQVSCDEIQYLWTQSYSWDSPDGTFCDREFQDVYLYRTTHRVKTQNSAEVSATQWMDCQQLLQLYREKNPAYVPHLKEFERLWRYIMLNSPHKETLKAKAV
jgi:isopentenyl-diphosphate Delta-isomerase